MHHKVESILLLLASLFTISCVFFSLCPCPLCTLTLEAQWHQCLVDCQCFSKCQWNSFSHLFFVTCLSDRNDIGFYYYALFESPYQVVFLSEWCLFWVHHIVEIQKYRWLPETLLAWRQKSYLIWKIIINSQQRFKSVIPLLPVSRVPSSLLT